ncbi:MAG: hypothetical protein ACRDQZ_21970, partial [Mycobacteriales bacterium]
MPACVMNTDACRRMSSCGWVRAACTTAGKGAQGRRVDFAGGEHQAVRACELLDAESVDLGLIGVC